jgi:phosphatidylinositol dimannoside acyltransferase
MSERAAQPEPQHVPRQRPGEGETFSERLSYNLYRTAEWAARTLPERTGRRVFSALAAAQHAAAPGVRRVVAENLSRVLGKPPDSPIVAAAVREAFRSYARYWFDTFLMRVIPPEEFVKRYTIHGRENLDAAIEGGRGALLCLPHLGNWDAAAKYVVLQGYSLSAVAEELRPPRLFELFLRHRRELGMGVIPLSNTTKVGEELVGLIARNELIALVSDRDLKNRGVVVEMFGAPRRIPAGPALLSLTTGSPLMPCATYDTEDGWMCVIGEPIEVERTGKMRDDVTALSRKLAACFEESIAAAPTQWHLFQPAWPPLDEEPAG